MERSTIKLEVNLINKIKEIQALNGYKSVNETVKHLLPKGTVTPETITHEQPAFTLNNKDNYKPVSWNELKKAETGKTWNNGEQATIIYKDEIGALIRFIDEYKEVYLNYFHFL
ncbi:hypothetical protein [uncultured Methanobrevibacter sp.]|uniref:hypothetical protein n=1 Tax=uncultured Methanobrevibacter sp. TaxID=253161 RepID=UPI00261AFEA2|nr:hypothetical protein [uncultured Methanobrevibacter sp.]